MSTYVDFLHKKIKLATFKGFKVEPAAMHEILFPHQRDIVQWAVLGGCRAIFAKFGLGKSVMQCEWLRQIIRAAGGLGLIVCPLGVRQELIRDAAMLGLKLIFIRSVDEIVEGHAFYITNYETIRDGKLDPNIFTAVSLDEASVLRSFGSKTYQEFLPLFDRVKFKLVNTATPSPNRFKELIHYAAFLGVMDSGQALTRFFQRDSEKAGNLTLYPHKTEEFWLWVSSWAVFLQFPSDLCGCPCHSEKISLASTSDDSPFKSGYREHVVTAHGDAVVPAAASGSQHRPTSPADKSSVVDASAPSMAPRKHQRTSPGEACLEESMAIGSTTLTAGSTSATAGADSSTSSLTSGSRRTGQRSSGSTTTAGTNRGTVDGQREKSRPETPAETSESSLTAGSSASPSGLRSSTSNTGHSIRATEQVGPSNECSSGSCARCAELNRGYVLPELDVRYHEVPSDYTRAGHERDGQALMFTDPALGLSAAAREKNDSMPGRIAKVAEIIAADPDDHFVVWHDLEAERHAIEDVLPRAEWNHWQEFKDGNPDGIALFERHYSALPYHDGRERDRFAGPGFKTVLLTRDKKALFVWRKFIDDSGQQGINCAVFRNEGDVLSSDLILEAMAIAWQRWPGERLYTFVNAKKVASANPGYCFKQAGWKECGRTKTRDLVILEALPGLPVPTVERHAVMQSVWGSQDLEERESRIVGFGDGEYRVLSTKPVIAGSGCNFQRHCHREIFAGIGFKFNDFIQAVHRCHRFQQKQRVVIDVVYSEAEREVLRSLQAKWTQHEEMVATMTEIIKKYGLNQLAMQETLARSLGIDRVEVSGERFTVANNDCVEEAKLLPENHVDLIVTSIPFANHYEYSARYEDFGHTEDNDHFWAQMDHLTPELLRILKPGRIYACHVKDRIDFGNVTGAGIPTVSPFHAEALFHGKKHGFDYMGMITVVTDVVRENNQTYRLGYTEMCKDGSKMGVGSPEYILLFHKPQSDRSKGYADVPIAKSKAEYSLARWQVDAHALWRSSGNRQLSATEMASYGPAKLAKAFTDYSLANVYDYEFHVKVGEQLLERQALPSTFMSLAPGSHCADVWHDVVRMITLNSEQSRRAVEKHVCPLQFDIVDRLIERYSNKDDLVYDPFCGLGTVPYRAILKGRRGGGSELNTAYFLDQVHYLRAAEREFSMPGLFDFEEAA